MLLWQSPLSAQPLVPKLPDDCLGIYIAIEARNLHQKDALDQVARQAGFHWSYNANLLDPAARVTVVSDHILVRESLRRIMGDGFSYKQNGKYVIMKRIKNPEQRLSGYVKDPKTGRGVPNATVYDPKTLRAAKTDQSGYYELKVGTGAREVVVSKLDYRDTVVQVTPLLRNVTELNLTLAPPPPSIPTTLHQDWAVFSYQMEHYFTTTLQRVDAMNVKNRLKRRFQVSLLPAVGTNGILGANVENGFSLNLTIGYSKGTKGLELGAIGNINRDRVSGLQIAGVFNGVGNDAGGVQIAGLLNHAGDTLTGLQIAGALNIAKTGYWSGQVASLVNVAGNGRMLMQVAGISNVADSLYALQVSGLSNHTFGYFQGVQAAGLLNTAWRATAAVQMAGLFNVNSHGSAVLQTAGLFNIADTLMGIQASPLLNVARKASGIQIGLINRAREIKGMQIGLLNFSRRGGYVIGEVSINDVAPYNLSYKSGTGALYTTFAGSMRPNAQDSLQLWAYGLGFGTRLRMGNAAAFTLEGVHRHVNFGRQHNNYLQEWSQGTLSLELKMGRALALYAAVTANAVFGADDNPNFETKRNRIVPAKPYRTLDLGDPRFTGWIGWSLGIRAGMFPRKNSVRR